MNAITDRLVHFLPDVDESAAKAKANKVGRKAQRVRHNRAFRGLARVGLGARAVVYLVVGALVIEIAVKGHASSAADSEGAFAELARQPGGTGILALLATGLFAYAVWRIVESFSRTPEGQSVSAWTRVGWVLISVLYAVLCVNCVELVFVASPSHSPAQHPSSFAGSVLGLPLGPELLGLVAAGAAGAAIGLIVWGVTQNYSKWLQTARMGSRSTLVVRVSGLAGNMARGLAVLLVATTLFVSAVSVDPMHAKSLDAALKALAAHPGGGLLLVAIGVGFLSFSVHSAMERAFDACRSTSCAHECPGPVSSGMNRPSQPAATAAR